MIQNRNLGKMVSTCSNLTGSLTRTGARSDLVGRVIAFTNFFAFSTLNPIFITVQPINLAITANHTLWSGNKCCECSLKCLFCNKTMYANKQEHTTFNTNLYFKYKFVLKNILNINKCAYFSKCKFGANDKQKVWTNFNQTCSMWLHHIHTHTHCFHGYYPRHSWLPSQRFFSICSSQGHNFPHHSWHYPTKADLYIPSMYLHHTMF